MNTTPDLSGTAATPTQGPRGTLEPGGPLPARTPHPTAPDPNHLASPEVCQQQRPLLTLPCGLRVLPPAPLAPPGLSDPAWPSENFRAHFCLHGGGVPYLFCTLEEGSIFFLWSPLEKATDCPHASQGYGHNGGHWSQPFPDPGWTGTHIPPCSTQQATPNSVGEDWVRVHQASLGPARPSRLAKDASV